MIFYIMHNWYLLFLKFNFIRNNNNLFIFRNYTGKKMIYLKVMEQKKKYHKEIGLNKTDLLKRKDIEKKDNYFNPKNTI